ncbi:MAG: hypothetical protein PHC64_06275 [Candidatus Gastranaerophilales bacterium]|nr:hypothetical protein [Candidatus Gastranaerophilales bacterium]
MADEITVTNNENPTINLEITTYTNEVDVNLVQSKGDKGDTGNTGPVYDWIGTLAEYTAGRTAGTITDTMVCYITDDASVGVAWGEMAGTLSNQTDLQSALDLKVDKITGKNLSANDLTDTLKSNYDTAYTNNHTHSNKTALDNVSGTNTGDQDLSGYATTISLSSHASNTSNPHSVTATQVGAPTISNGTTAPTSTPAKVGDIYIDTTNTKFYVAKGSSSNSDWVKQNGSYTLQTQSTSSGPADATTYFIGSAAMSLTSTASVRRIYIPRSGTITYCKGAFLNGSVGTSENSSLYIRVNATTDYLVSSTIDNSSYYAPFENSGLNIPVSAGDYIEIKWITPTWATNPTGVSSSSVICVDL